MIPFNKPYVTGNEISYIQEVISLGKIASNGKFTEKCERFFEERYGFKRALLTTSCTTALEMAALLIDIKLGDEIIVPSYTYVSTANVFEKLGGKIVFADACAEFPNLDPDNLEKLITPNTKAIVPMHYGGVSCDMERIMKIAERHQLYVIEDAAMSIDNTYENKYIGSIGHFAAFSFHETKNISCGEGGLLVVNDPKFIERAEILRDKGTNRKQFLNGAIDKYEWVDIGGSFAPNEFTAAYLFSQLEEIDFIQRKRMEIWNTYACEFEKIQSSLVEIPKIPAHSRTNGQGFFVVCNSKDSRDSLIAFMAKKDIQLSFHYQALHQSKYYLSRNPEISLPNAERFSDCLVRFPLFTDLQVQDVEQICKELREFLRECHPPLKGE
ncbi:MAG: dTDP-4-amino-4,6-dideoxygalactose transaminase [Bacteroidetes bacterium]|nr:dTDP-4-amino-4,6-dideoxygalactose transaminase [Bacteroidota bacterium]